MGKLQSSDTTLNITSKSKAKSAEKMGKIIMELRDNDVLCGKEKNCVNHPGSRNFRAIIDQYASKYHEAVTKQEKMAVTKEIYDNLGADNGRFLKHDSKADGWLELSSLLARDKISHALRFANREASKSGAASVSTSTPSKSKSKKGHHRRGDSETSTNSDSTFTTVATEMSDDELEGFVMDDEPLEWKIDEECEDDEEAERPYAYEVNYETPVPAAAAPYYHTYGPHPHAYYYYQHPYGGYPHYGHYSHYYQQAPVPPTPLAYPPARPSPVEREESCLTSFPDEPQPVRKNSSMDIDDLSFLVNEPLLEWDMKTDEVFICE